MKRGVAILVDNIDAPGGMERQALRLAEAIARRGRPVVIVSSWFPLVSEKWRPFVERRSAGERRRQLTIYRLPFVTTLWWGYPTSRELYETLAAWLLLRHRATLGAIYGVQAGSGGVHAARLAPVLGLPAVAKLACSGEAGDFHGLLREKDAPRTLALLRRLDRVVHLNDESRDEAIAAGLDPARLLRIPNGIDPRPFEDAPPAELPELAGAGGGEETRDRELVLFVGRHSRQKRLLVLLEAFALLAKRRDRARLALAGDGPDRPALEARARELGLAGPGSSGKVAFLGTRRDVPALLRAARVFVLPSAEEGISNAILEAFAARVPVVASDIAGNRAILRKDEDGLLVPVDDAPALARALERVLAEPELAARLACSARARLDQELAIDEVARRYLALFDGLPRERVTFAGFLVRYARSELTPLSWLAARSFLRTIRTAAVVLASGLGSVARRAGVRA